MYPLKLLATGCSVAFVAREKLGVLPTVVLPGAEKVRSYQYTNCGAWSGVTLHPPSAQANALTLLPAGSGEVRTQWRRAVAEDALGKSTEAATAETDPEALYPAGVYLLATVRQRAVLLLFQTTSRDTSTEETED
ncbi:MAG: hypothetical protein QXW40_08225 [Thermofilum sp.]